MRWAKIPALLAICYVALITAVLLGMTTSGTGLLPRLASPAELGLGSNRVGIEPLTERFIDRALGPNTASSNAQSDPVSSRGRGGVDGVDEALGEVVDHAFTNNDQGHAYAVTRLPFTGRTSTTDADREAGEPECGTALGGTVWYRYTATRNEALLADTFGTGYQTSLAAYRQSSSGPVPLENACDFDPQGNSQIKIDASSGTTYLFQISAAVRGGALTFNLKRFGGTSLVSVSTTGKPGNAPSKDPSVSLDGRYVAFTSLATNLVPGMIGPRFYGDYTHVFLRDRQAGTTSLVSVGLDGKPGNGESQRAHVSDDGRYVSFDSQASDLVSGDTNSIGDVFVRDMGAGRTERVSVSSRGDEVGPILIQHEPETEGRTDPYGGAMSADGRYVAFCSLSPDLVEGDNDQTFDIFVRDRLYGTTNLVSLGNEGEDSPADVDLNSISRNGRWIVFNTEFPMSERDQDLSDDYFVRDLWTSTTELVSVPAAGHELEGLRPTGVTTTVSQRSISDDGRFVVFGSYGALVDGDTNNYVDVFVRDRLRQTTERVSVSSSGGEGVGAPYGGTGADSRGWAISGDGRKVAFTTPLNLLEPSDRNNLDDLFVHDRTYRVTLRVSASGDVAGGDEIGGYAPRISGDGMYITFHGTYPFSHSDRNTFNDIFMFSPLAVSEQVVVKQRCVTGEGGCLPTHQECATGQFNGYHDGGTPERGAVCVGAGDKTILYVAGNHVTDCGTIIAADQTIIYGSDPNNCPGAPPESSEVPPPAAMIGQGPAP